MWVEVFKIEKKKSLIIFKIWQKVEKEKVLSVFWYILILAHFLLTVASPDSDETKEKMNCE